MITGITNIYLYTKDVFNEKSSCFKAKKFLDDNQISYVNLNYPDSSQHEELLSAVSSWWRGEIEVKAFPFLHYTEVHEDLDPSQYPIEILRGLTQIRNSNLAELNLLGKD
jgi:hypothetical protein